MKNHDHSSMSHQDDEDKSSKKIQYTCSMHPEVVSDQPGKCPKCGMKLVKKEEETHEMSGHKMEGMGSRGVTRPMMDMEKHDTMQGHENMDMGAMKMSAGDRMQMLKDHHKQTLWVYWTIVLLGFWMIASPLTFDYGKNVVAPAGGRPVWLSLSDRIATMYWSDIISGILLVIFGWRSLKPNRPYSVWIICFIGIWISMARFIFWAPTAIAYYNSTMVGFYYCLIHPHTGYAQHDSIYENGRQCTHWLELQSLQLATALTYDWPGIYWVAGFSLFGSISIRLY